VACVLFEYHAKSETLLKELALAVFNSAIVKIFVIWFCCNFWILGLLVVLHRQPNNENVMTRDDKLAQ
jgi:hypothetical protein